MKTIYITPTATFIVLKKFTLKRIIIKMFKVGPDVNMYTV